jgi:hypothetical protein
MEDGVNWQKECEKWLTPTAPYTRKEINTELYQEVKEIIESTKGPYPAFHKKMKLTDLLTIVR